MAAQSPLSARHRSGSRTACPVFPPTRPAGDDAMTRHHTDQNQSGYTNDGGEPAPREVIVGPATDILEAGPATPTIQHSLGQRSRYAGPACRSPSPPCF